MLNFKLLGLSSEIKWKFKLLVSIQCENLKKILSHTQILCEINLEAQKLSFWQMFEAFCSLYILSEQQFLRLSNYLANIHFTENLIGRTFVKFPHCLPAWRRSCSQFDFNKYRITATHEIKTQLGNQPLYYTMLWDTFSEERTQCGKMRKL